MDTGPLDRRQDDTDVELVQNGQRVEMGALASSLIGLDGRLRRRTRSTLVEVGSVATACDGSAGARWARLVRLGWLPHKLPKPTPPKKEGPVFPVDAAGIPGNP